MPKIHVHTVRHSPTKGSKPGTSVTCVAQADSAARLLGHPGSHGWEEGKTVSDIVVDVVMPRRCRSHGWEEGKMVSDVVVDVVMLRRQRWCARRGTPWP